MLTVGFIGLGNLGLPIAANLLKAGHTMKVYNRSKEKTKSLAAMGATVVDQPYQTATPGGIVISLVSDDHAVKIIASDELARALGPGGIHISMSTISADTSRALATHHQKFGASYISAPVFARPEAAAARMGSLCLSGATLNTRNQIRDLLTDGVAKQIFDFGDDAGAANVVKLIGNFMIAASIELLAESFSMAEKNNLSPQSVYDMLTSTLFAAPVFQNYGKIMLAGQFERASFRLALGLKDINLVLQNGNQTQTPLPFANIVHDRMLKCIANGNSDHDWSSFSIEARRDAGIL